MEFAGCVRPQSIIRDYLIRNAQIWQIQRSYAGALCDAFPPHSLRKSERLVGKTVVSYQEC